MHIFFKSETSDAQNIKRVRKALTDRKIKLLLKINFIGESVSRIQQTVTKLERNEPFSPVMYRKIGNMITYLSNDAAKMLGKKTNAYLNKLC